jgi:hypothetical protein
MKIPTFKIHWIVADIRSELRDVSGANQVCQSYQRHKRDGPCRMCQVYRINNSATVGGEDRSLRKLKAYQRPVQCEKVLFQG